MKEKTEHFLSSIKTYQKYQVHFETFDSRYSATFLSRLARATVLPAIASTSFYSFCKLCRVPRNGLVKARICCAETTVKRHRSIDVGTKRALIKDFSRVHFDGPLSIGRSVGRAKVRHQTICAGYDWKITTRRFVGDDCMYLSTVVEIGFCSSWTVSITIHFY